MQRDVFCMLVVDRADLGHMLLERYRLELLLEQGLPTA